MTDGTAMTAISAAMEIYKFKWRYHHVKKIDGRSVLESERLASEEEASRKEAKPETIRDQSSTHHGRRRPIKITAATKRRVPEGVYVGRCVKVEYPENKNQYGRWEAILWFDLEPPCPAGIPLPFHINMGRKKDPELPADHFLTLLMNRFGGLERIAGDFRFHVTVRTVTKHPHDDYDRPQELWYSVVERAVLLDDILLSR